jgi:hypothetical protein
MRRLSLLLALSAPTLLPGPTLAADLSKVERTIKKEPAYKTKPLYCLLVFGPEARTRAWLVLDGDSLYIDRNGNGDLTEPGEHIPRASANSADARGIVEQHIYVDLLHPGKPNFGKEERNVPTLKGTSRYTHCVVYYTRLNPNFTPKTKEDEQQRKEAAKIWDGYVDFYVRMGDALSERARAKPAARPQDAPVVHLDGPLTFEAVGSVALRPGLQPPPDLRVHLVTPGVGEGAVTTLRDFLVVPQGLHPVADIEFPPKRAGEKPIRKRYELKERC